SLRCYFVSEVCCAFAQMPATKVQPGPDGVAVPPPARPRKSFPPVSKDRSRRLRAAEKSQLRSDRRACPSQPVQHGLIRLPIQARPAEPKDASAPHAIDAGSVRGGQ